MIIDFRKLSIEVFASRCREYFGSKVAILPNATVLKHCLHLSEFHNSEVELDVYYDGKESTAYMINHKGSHEQLLGVFNPDNTSIEYRSEDELKKDIDEGLFD